MKLRNKLANAVVVLVMLLAFFPVGGPVLAGPSLDRGKNVLLLSDQESNQGCSNLDVVFIVDQSWAMTAPGTQEAADPMDQRKFAVDAMIDLLTGLALDQCPGTHHRISVISYGSSAQVDLKMYSINPETAEEANQLRDENGIKKYVVAQNLGGYNNPEAAFTEAARIWRTTPTVDDDADGVNRKKVIIFLTNGISKSSPNDYAKSTQEVKYQVNSLFPFDENLLALETCLSKLRDQGEDGYIPPEQASVCFADHKVDQRVYDNSTYIWTVFLKPPGYEKYGQAYESIINNYDEMSRAHGGEAIELKATSRKDVPSTFRKILSYLAGVRPVLLNCGEFAMNPYLREARLTVYKIDPDIKITLSYKDTEGINHSITGGTSNSLDAFHVKDYYAFGANEAYILSYPYAGIWQLTADNCQGLDTYYEQVVIDTSQNLDIPDLIPQYEVKPFYDPEHPQYLVYEMHDKETGVLIPQTNNPRFAVDTTAIVISPKGEKTEYKLNWDAKSQSFTANTPLLVAADGVYDVHVTGVTYQHVGDPSPLNTVIPDQVFDRLYTLFDVKTQFEVAPVTPFTIDIVSPAPGMVIKNVHDLSFDRWPPLAVAPLKVQVRLLDRSGVMLPNPVEYLATTQDAFTAHLEGGGRIAEVKLQPDLNNPGYFIGTVSDFEVVGAGQKITVVMDESAMLKDRRPYDREVEGEFTRVDQLFHTPQFWRFSLIAFILSVVIYTIKFFADRTNKVSGTLLFYDGSAFLTDFNLHSGRNWRDIRERELKNFPQLNLKKIRVSSSMRPKQRIPLEEFGSSIIPSGVRISGVAYDGRKFDFELPPEQPVPYDSETPFSMMYQPIEKQ